MVKDLADTGTLLVQRLDDWKHLVRWLEGYASATQKAESTAAKEVSNTVVKAAASELKLPNHFDAEPGGVRDAMSVVRAATKVSEICLSSTVVLFIYYFCSSF